jgi:hypothetical protein
MLLDVKRLALLPWNCRFPLHRPAFSEHSSFWTIRDDLLLMLVHPASNGDDQKGKLLENPALLQVIMQRVILPPF